MLSSGENECLHQLFEKRISDWNEVGQVLGPDGIGMSYTGRQQPIGNRLGVHVRELVFRQIMDQRFLEPRHQSSQRPRLGFQLEELVGTVPNASGEASETFRQLLGRCNNLSVTELKGCGPPFPP